MGRLLDIAKAAAGEKSLSGAFGRWILAVSGQGDQIPGMQGEIDAAQADIAQTQADLDAASVLVAYLLAQNVIPDGTLPGQPLTWNEATANEWDGSDIAPLYAPVQDWATFIALVNAQAALGRAVQMGPGTWTCDVSGLLASNAHIIGGPAVIINSTIPLVAPFTDFVFYKFAGLSAVVGTLQATPVLGAVTVSSTVSVAAGTRVWIGQTAATAHDYLAQQYTVRSVAGAGPFTLTLDRAVLLPFVAGDELRLIVSPTDNIVLDGRGMTITGRGDRAIEFTGGWRCRVSNINYAWDGATNFGAFCSLDIGCLDCSVENCTVDNPVGVSAHGVLQESCEHCIVRDVRVTGGSVGFIGYDSVGCAFESCDSSRATQAGVLLTSNTMSVGCRDVVVSGGSYSGVAAGSGILVGYATDCILRGPRAIANQYGINSGTVAVRLRGDGTSTGKNTNRGIYSQASGAVWVAPSSNGDVSAIGANDSCDIISPQLDDFSSYGVIANGGAATSRVNVFGGRISSAQTGVDSFYIASGALTRIAGTHLAMTGVAANQVGVHHIAGAGPVVLDGVTATEASASRGYLGDVGCTVRWGSRTDFGALTTPFVVNAAGFGSVGQLVSGGAGAAQAVAWPDLKASDHITTVRSVNGGAPGLAPLVVKTPATGFAATFAAGDTSTYEYRVE